MNTDQVHYRKFFAALLSFVACFTAAAIGHAQTAPQAPATDSSQTIKMQEMVVTGSNIPMAADSVNIPIAVISQENLVQSGVAADTLDILRKIAPNISGVGSENAQIASGSNFGGASVTIKGMSTLVLIDGRRVVNDPAESVNGSQFVDLNMIPPAAIERIDVLQDGASAVYGSDAIGGVINIILKKDYNGWEVGSHYGFSKNKGDYEERSGYLVGGVSKGDTSITVGVDYNQHNPMYLADFSYTNPIYGTYTYPGSLEVYDNLSGSDNFYMLAPGVNAPPGGGTYTLAQLIARGIYVPLTTSQAFHEFNLANGETMIQSEKRYSAMATWEHKIAGDNLVAFGNFLASHTWTWSQLNAQPVVPYIQDPWIDINVQGFSSSPPPAGTTYIPVTAPTNPFLQSYIDQNQAVPESGPGNGDGSGEEILPRMRLIQDPRLYQNDSEMVRLVGGLKGDITDKLHWETAVNINRYTLAYTNPGLIDTSALLTALADGQINPFAVTQAAGALNGVVGTAFVNMLSTLNSWDAKLDGTLFTLPTGDVGFAVGGSYVHEGMSATPDVNSLPNSTGTTQGWSNATTFQNFEATRNIKSYFAELSVPLSSAKQNVPLINAANVDGAVRSDSYDGAVGSTTTPQVNVSWQPFNDQFKLRASAGKSFIAPLLYALYGPVSSGSTDSITYRTKSGSSNTAQFNQTGGSNPDLKPSTADTWTVGFVATPKFLKNFSLSVDYNNVNQKLIPGVIPAATVIQSVENLGSASPYDQYVHYNSPTGATPSAAGGISNHSPQSIYVIANLVNLSGQKVGSTDIKLEYVFDLGGEAKLDLSSTWTAYNSYELQLIPTEPYYQYAGDASQNEGTVPKWRTYTGLDFTDKGFDVFLGGTYVAGVADVGVGGDTPSVNPAVSAFKALDASLSYNFSALHVGKFLDGLKVTVGVNNLTNAQPPEAQAAFPNTNADVGTYDGPIGRMWFVNATYKF
jgi:iron complex outermembrane recepter protein